MMMVMMITSVSLEKYLSQRRASGMCLCESNPHKQTGCRRLRLHFNTFLDSKSGRAIKDSKMKCNKLIKIRPAKHGEALRSQWIFFFFFVSVFRQVFTEVPLQHSWLTLSTGGNRSAGRLADK